MPLVSWWRSPDPSLSNLKAVIEPNWSAIMATGGWDYPSLCMKKGIQPDKLVKTSAVLMGCMQLDPRGGYIRQDDAFQVICKIVLMPQHQFTFEAYCVAKQHPSVVAGVRRVAYSLRVMLSHTREKFSQWKGLAQKEARSHPDWLVEIYNVISEELPRSSKVPNPFIHLREPDECEEESEDEEVPSIIHVQVGADKKATMLWSDGSNITADYYEPGDKGFAIAVWLAASNVKGHVYETEIPNVYISQDKSHLGADIK